MPTNKNHSLQNGLSQGNHQIHMLHTIFAAGVVNTPVCNPFNSLNISQYSAYSFSYKILHNKYVGH